MTLVYRVPQAAEDIRLRECQCSFCRRHGARYTSHPESSLAIHSADAALLTRYRFATATADFLLCARCGVLLAATCELDGRLQAVVNTAVFENFVAAPDHSSQHDFDAENLDDRLARRKRNWIPDVTVHVGNQ